MRFRSIAFDAKFPDRKSAFLAKKLNTARKSVNAYIRFDVPEAAAAAVSHMNGSLFMNHHLRVDSCGSGVDVRSILVIACALSNPSLFSIMCRCIVTKRPASLSEICPLMLKRNSFGCSLAHLVTSSMYESFGIKSPTWAKALPLYNSRFPPFSRYSLST